MKKIALISTMAICPFWSTFTCAGTMGPVSHDLSWSGIYVGANAGYGWGENNARLHIPRDAASQAFFRPAVKAGAMPRNIGFDQDGFLGGVQVGYNRQFNRIVGGLEMEIDGANINGTTSVKRANRNNGFGPFVGYAGSTLNWLFNFRGRIGYTVVPQGLLYATGGFAFGGSAHSYNSVFTATNDIFSSIKNDNKIGYIVGGGYEWMFDPKWSVKAEYLYYNLERAKDITYPGGRDIALVAANKISPLSNFFKDTGNVVRLGLNYHFS
jgi:outer membrane immunogenic protein